jgi:predicted CXXCH cytochrome family protein
MLNREFTHEKTITENCYFCHEVHSSNFQHLLRADENMLCRTCHALVGKGQRGFRKTALSVKDHKLLVSYAISVGVPSEQSCGFCHRQEQHVSKMETMDSATCTGCHTYVSRIVNSNTKGVMDIHKKFGKRKCSECHDAHSGQYPYQLNQPVKTFLE